MGKIIVLDELTINKIAAGEVIERPASVIKEMVENSIDAEAKNISIEIKNGGISYIRVTDDGKGIDEDDLELSFERHATSKIRTAEDLNEIRSMGFRGEALASIAAIARVEMKTKTKEAEIGHRIVVEGGGLVEVEEVGCPCGTSITVENLFFNTPVRYKFLKKDYTETGYIEDVITRIALVHPEISFRLINAGKTIIQTTGDGDIKNVIYSIYGKDVASACLNVNYTYEGITITGVVGKPEIARSNRGNQIFFVNKRYIKDRILSNATEKAFKGMIPIGKFGFLVLNLDMAPSAVDVNVHPAKLEVRFQDEQTVFKAVYYAIQDTLLKAELIANSETQITGKLEKSKHDDEPKSDENHENTEIPETKNSITNLFRKISKSSNKDFEYGSNNVIESIFKSKEEKKQEEKELNEEFTIQTEKENDENSDQQTAKEFDQESESQRVEELNQEANKENGKIVEFENKEEVNEYKENLSNNDTNNVVSDKNEEYQPTSMDIQKIEQIIADLKRNKEEFERKTGLSVEQIETPPRIKSDTQNEVQENIETENVEAENSEQVNLEQENSTQENSVQNDEGTENIIQEKTNQTETESTMQNYETSEIKDKEESAVQEETTAEDDNKEENENQIQAEEDTDEPTTEVNFGISQDTASNIRPGDILTNLVKERNKENLDNNFSSNDEEISEKFNDMYEQIFGKSSTTKKKEEDEERKTNAQDILTSNMSIFEDDEQFEDKIPYKFIGIAFKTYIILEIENELYILDQHAAHERIMYEKVKKNYYSDEDKDSQLMLLPDIITLTHKEMDILRENIDKFEKAGFVLEEFGDNTIKLTGVPNICLDLDTKELFLETLDEINTVARTAKQEIEERFIATIACKAAVKANMALTEDEVTSLLDQLLLLKNPFTCPHGRPTAIKLDKSDIEKKFARRK